MTGTLLNVATIIGGATVGTLLGARVGARLRGTVTDVLGVFVVILGVSDALRTFSPGLSGPLGRSAVLVVLGSLLLGGLLGELMDIEGRLASLGVWLRDRTVARRTSAVSEAESAAASGEGAAAGRERFVEGFVVTSLIVTVGPLAVLGALQDGLAGDWQLLAVKSMLDGSVAVAFGSVFGIGVAFAALPLLVWQGGLTLVAGSLGAGLSPLMVEALTATGGFLVAAIGLRLLEIRQVRVANLLPALILAPATVALLS